MANLKGNVSPLIQPGTPSPLRLSAPAMIRNFPGFPGPLKTAIATDFDNIMHAVNALHTAGQNVQGLTQLLLTNPQGQVIAAFGNTTFRGVIFTNWLQELHVGDFTLSGDPTKSVFNANTDGSISIGNNGWLDIHDPFDGNAAWIGTQNDTLTITNAIRGPGNVIRLTIPGHPLATGNVATVRNMNLVNVPNANGSWGIIVIDANTIDLLGSVWAGPFIPIADPPSGLVTYQPTIDRILQITNAVDNGSGKIRLTTNVSHNYETGTAVNVPAPGPGGVPNAVGQWTVTVIDPTTFDLDNSTFAGGYTSGGTVLEYFAGMLAQTLAIGPSFSGYKLRAFPDGSLRIRNASIELNSPGGDIIINPDVPEIDLKSATAEINLNAATGQIVLSAASPSLAKIVLDAAVPSIKLYNAAGALTVTIDSTGSIVAQTVSSSGGFTGPVVVRNSAGTGVSTLTFSGGILTGYAP